MRITRRAINQNPAGLGHLPQIIQRIYAARGIFDAKLLNKQLSSLLPYQQLSGISEAAQHLLEAITQQQKILVVGDYDVDGATSVALMILAINAMGGRIDYLVPNRFTYGYGLTPKIVELAKERYAPDLLITVDNGITSIEGARLAAELGMKLIITDHHLPAAELPQAIAIVNPNQIGDQFASKNLAGVGVAFYILIALRAALREANWFKNSGLVEPNLADWLDLVAVGTVADVVPLDYKNRILVQHGLQRIRSGRCRWGIQALLKLAKRNLTLTSTRDIGFAVGPRLNAAGRLEDMSLGVACLLADNLETATRQAVQLDNLNQERRAIEDIMCEQALWLVDKIIVENREFPAGFCLFKEDWHQGVIGIVAGRMKEKLNRPVIAFAREDQYKLKGSGRSIEGINLKNILQIIHERNFGLLEKFGGHAMAAGLSISAENLAEFTRQFNLVIQENIDPQIFTPNILTDGELNLADFTLEIAEKLRDLEPWGQHFPEPLFDGEFWVEHASWLQNKHLKLRLRIDNTQKFLSGIMFNVEDKNILPELPAKINLVYQLNINQYQDQKDLQLLIKQLWV